MSIKTYYEQAPVWAKGIAITVLVVGTGLIVREIIVSSKKKRDLKTANKAGEEASKELKELAAKGIVPTYSNSEFESFSLTLQNAMNGCGTDEEAVMNVIRKMRNEADIRKLVESFGVRFYQPCAASQPISYTRYLLDKETFYTSLPGWITYDLTSSEVSQVNSILKSSGINYTF